VSTAPASNDLPQRRLTRQSTAQQVADILRDDIISGSLERGRPLREESVAAAFAVSRRSARDALRILEGDGLVRHQRNRGSTVTDFSPEDLDDLYAARTVIEPAAARRCTDQAARSTPAFAALAQAMADLRRATAADDRRGIVAADVHFHVALAGLLGSPRIDKFFAAIASEMMYAIALLEAHEKIRTSHRPQESLDEHQAIFDALVAGQAELAHRLVVEHLDVSNRSLGAVVAPRRSAGQTVT
jgi:DNA-binding GntR family transcriptional regulator